MTLLRRVVRIARPVVETLLAGILLGVVVMVFAGQVVASNTPAPASELPVARAFMLAVMRNDQPAMEQLTTSADVLADAIQFQKRAQVLANVKLSTLTFLGSSSIGPFGVHLYVIQADASSGTTLVPFALTVFQGKVVGLKTLATPVASS